MSQSDFNPLSYPVMFSIPRYLSGASSWSQHIPFAFLITQLTRPATLVELGAYAGDSYLAFCQAIAELGLPTRCWAVDTWVGDPHSGFYGPEILQWLRARHDGIYPFSTLLQTEFDLACAKFETGQIDLLHIDGLHTYDAVKHDFESWLPKLSERAVVLFHDTCVTTRNFGVWKLWEELSGQYPSFEFLHGWGLGILAVGREKAPAELLAFLDFARRNTQVIHGLFTALGERMEYVNQHQKVAAAVTEQSAHFRQLAQAMGMPWDLPVDLKTVATDVVGCARGMSQHLAALARDLPQMRNHVRQLEAEVKRLRANASGPRSTP